jgi:hypothetical protein
VESFNRRNTVFVLTLEAYTAIVRKSPGFIKWHFIAVLMAITCRLQALTF